MHKNVVPNVVNSILNETYERIRDRPKCYKKNCLCSVVVFSCKKHSLDIIPDIADTPRQDHSCYSQPPWTPFHPCLKRRSRLRDSCSLFLRIKKQVRTQKVVSLKTRIESTPGTSVGSGFYLEKVPSFEAREAHRYWNNQLGIFRARGLLDHP